MVLLLFTFFNSCKKNDYPPFYKQDCQVLSTTVSGGNNYITNYIYDKKGYVSSSATNVKFSSIEITYQFNYTRDKNGRTINLESVYSDNQGNSGIATSINLIYDSRGERVIKLVEMMNDEAFLEHNLRYDFRGLVTEFTNEYAFPELSAYNSKSFFEYNAIGQLTKISVADAEGKILRYKSYENKGKNPTNESYLIDHGLLPFDLVFGEVYSIVDGGVGTVLRAYNMKDDKAILVGTYTTKSITLNQRGFPATIQIADEAGNETNVNYQFDCAGKSMK